MAALILQFLIMLVVGGSVFWFVFDIWPANAEAWLVVLALGLFVCFGLGLVEKIFLRISDLLMPALWTNSRYMKQFMDDGPLLKSLNSSLFLFRLARICLLMVIVLFSAHWLSKAVDLPSGYEVRSFMKEHWRVELHPV